jgi:2-keto-4-pentenoate hydratase/2-oxohepta-3-ene-1,7-dioic acid hydratase in catechol pathway
MATSPIHIDYRHRDDAGSLINLPLGKVVCVGRNYVDHIQELNNAIPDEPLLFIKPATSLCDLASPLCIPVDKGSCHNELELALLLKNPLRKATVEQAQAALWGIGLGLDLTLRELQAQLKAKGLPWERAKAFDFACPMSGFVPVQEFPNLADIQFDLLVNHVPRQSGNSRLMIWDAITLLQEISQVFTLLPGDIVMTGTPKGVGPLQVGDQLEVSLASRFRLTTVVQQEPKHAT